MNRMAGILSLSVLLWGCFATEGDVLTPVGSRDSDHGFGDPACTTLECPTAALDSLVFCGHVVDLETSTFITESPPVLQFHAEEDFVSDPDGAVALSVVEPDDCGRFATTIPSQPGETNIPSVVIHAGDPGAAPVGDEIYRRTFSVVTTKNGAPHFINAFALRTSTDRLWGEETGQGGDGIGSKGPMVAIFVDTEADEAQAPFPGALVEGVTLTVDGMILEQQDFYFSDGDPMVRRTIGPKRSNSGATGTGILIVPGLRPGAVCSGQHPDQVVESSAMLVLEGLVQVQEIATRPDEPSVPDASM